MKYIDADGLAVVIRDLAREYDVYGPRRMGDDVVLARLSTDEARELVWSEFRVAESFKPFFFQPGKIVAQWTENGPQEGSKPRPRALFGLKGCDLKALGVIDKVFRDHEFQEPSWCAARDQNLVIAGDCTAAGPSCFCTMVEDDPWPTDLFDLALSPHETGWLVDVGSRQGEAIVASYPTLFVKAPAGAVEARDERRKALRDSVVAANAQFAVHDPFAKSVEKNVKTSIWGKLAATCVECNACNIVCPTCHCFVLNDVEAETGACRVSSWDSCFHAGYARMAGGGTPRLQLTERFKNHYFHKFVAFPRNWGVTACSGCGRCVDACMGRIDKRECLHRLEAEWLPSEVLSEVR